MEVVIQSEHLDQGCSATWDFPEPVDWFFMGSDGVSVKKVSSAKRATIDEIEVSGPDIRSVKRKIKELLAGLAECAGAGGRAILGVRTHLMTLGGTEPVSFCQLTMAFVPGDFGSETERFLQWLPQIIVVDDGFWEELDNMETVEEVLLS